MFVKCFLAIFFSISVLLADGANRFSRPDGTWSATNGGPNCGCTPTQNDDIFVNHNITLAGPYTVNTGSLTINATATLTVNGNLTFNNGSSVTINEGAGLVVLGNFENKNNSNDITFDGAIQITGNFQNGTGGSGSAIIDFGPNATISIGGTCSNAGVVNDTSGSYSGCGQGVLPVKLSYFTAELEESEVVMRWATIQEDGFDKFVLERSSTGLDFYSIGDVKGVGMDTYNVETKYSFTDNAPLVGFNYYRLVAHDLDGHIEYFNVRLVRLDGPKTLSVFPNPSDGNSMLVQLNFNPSEYGRVVLLNSLGIKIAESPVLLLESQLIFQNGLAPGVYLLKYISPEFQSTVRVLVGR
jgi:hypothetical protein